MKRQPTQHKSWRAVGAVLLFNAATVLLLTAYFAPQWLPFMHTQAEGTVVIPASVAPVDGTLSATGQPVVAGKPVRIRVPSVGIDLPIADGVYDQKTGKWSLSKDHAHYALISPVANNTEGNTFIYGHNRHSVFAPLLKAKTGDKVYIETDNQKVFEYTLRSAKDVEPNDVSLFTYTGKPILTLQTCSGTWYEHRRLFTFDFVKVEPLT